jgi:uncharacterized protein YjeT (DUF2065 family)
MSPLDFKDPSITRRLDRVMRRERLRTALKIAGIALLTVGIGMVIYPFGPPVSNPVIIPKADPSAGIALIQALPSGATRLIGLAFAFAGAISLVVFAFLSIGTSENDPDRHA